MLFNQSDTLKSARSHAGIYTPRNTLPGPTCLNISNGISTSSAVFEQLTEKSPCTLQSALKRD